MLADAFDFDLADDSNEDVVASIGRTLRGFIDDSCRFDLDRAVAENSLHFGGIYDLGEEHSKIFAGFRRDEVRCEHESEADPLGLLLAMNHDSFVGREHVAHNCDRARTSERRVHQSTR